MQKKFINKVQQHFYIYILSKKVLENYESFQKAMKAFTRRPINLKLYCKNCENAQCSSLPSQQMLVTVLETMPLVAHKCKTNLRACQKPSIHGAWIYSLSFSDHQTSSHEPSKHQFVFQLLLAMKHFTYWPFNSIPNSCIGVSALEIVSRSSNWNLRGELQFISIRYHGHFSLHVEREVARHRLRISQLSSHCSSCRPDP